MTMNSERVHGSTEKELAAEKELALKVQKIIGENILDWVKTKFREGKNKRPINIKTADKPGIYYKIIAGFITKEDPNGDHIFVEGNNILQVYLFFKPNKKVKIKVKGKDLPKYFFPSLDEVCQEEGKSDFKKRVIEEIAKC
jgi:hypothetical protein